MWVRAIRDHYHSKIGTKIITEGKQYKVTASNKTMYTLRNDRNKVCIVDKDLFEIM